MKTINTYSAQFKIIQPHQNNKNHPNSKSFAQSFAPKSNPNPNKKKLPKDRQEFINNISSSGFKQCFSLLNGSIQLCNI